MQATSNTKASRLVKLDAHIYHDAPFLSTAIISFWPWLTFHAWLNSVSSVFCCVSWTSSHCGKAIVQNSCTLTISLQIRFFFQTKNIFLIIFSPQKWMLQFSSEVLHWGSSNINTLYPQNMFSWRNTKSFFFIDFTDTVFTLSVRTPQLLTIYVLTLEQVQFTTRCCVYKVLDEWQTV